MKIGDVAKKSGIPASTLRYYVSQGLITKPSRVGGKRVYDPAVLDLLLIIQSAKEAGFTVAEIHRLLRGFSSRTTPSKRWRTLAEKRVVEIDDRMQQLRGMKQLLGAMLNCQCPSFDDCAMVIRKRRRG